MKMKWYNEMMEYDNIYGDFNSWTIDDKTYITSRLTWEYVRML